MATINQLGTSQSLNAMIGRRMVIIPKGYQADGHIFSMRIESLQGVTIDDHDFQDFYLI